MDVVKADELDGLDCVSEVGTTPSLSDEVESGIFNDDVIRDSSTTVHVIWYWIHRTSKELHGCDDCQFNKKSDTLDRKSAIFVTI